MKRQALIVALFLSCLFGLTHAEQKQLYYRSDFTINYVRYDDPYEVGNKFVTGNEPPTVIALGFIDLHDTNPVGDPDGVVSTAEYNAWAADPKTEWRNIPLCATGKLADLEDVKVHLGFLKTQHKTFIHFDIHLQQIACVGWPDDQTKYWPTNALQGDVATWDMLFELITDP